MMKDKKKSVLSTKIQRQIEILQKYYDIDLENRIITLELNYDHVSELFEDSLVSTKIPKFNSQILKRVSEIMDSFPLEFDIDLKLKINDYGEYQPEMILNSFKDALEMFHYSMHREKSGRLLTAVILTLVSVAILFFRQFALATSLITEEYLLSEMLDITAWVFLWQAVTVLFLTPNELREISFKILTRLHAISLLKNDQLLMCVSQDEIQSHWVQITKAERLSKRFLIIVGAFSLATGVMNIINSTQLFILVGSYDAVSIISFIFVALIEGVVSIGGGIGAISLFRDKGPLQKFVAISAYLYLIADILIVGSLTFAYLFGWFNGRDVVSLLVSNSIFIIVSILYFISYCVLRHVRKINQETYAQRKSHSTKSIK